MSRIRYDVKVKYDENNNPVDILSADNKALNVVTTKTDPTSGGRSFSDDVLDRRVMYEWIDPRDWVGFDLTGSNDNSGILQSAIDEAGYKLRTDLGYGVSKRLRLPAGRIAFSSQLLIRQNSWIEGVFGADGGTMLWWAGQDGIDAISNVSGIELSMCNISNLRLEDKRTGQSSGRGVAFKDFNNGVTLKRVQVMHFPLEQIYIGADSGMAGDCTELDDVWVLSNKATAKGILLERLDNNIIINNIKSDLTTSPSNDGYVIRCQNFQNDNTVIAITNVKHESNNRCPTVSLPINTRGNISIRNVIQRNPQGGAAGAGDVIQIGAAAGVSQFYFDNTSTGLITGAVSEQGGRLIMENISGLNHSDWTGATGAAVIRCLGTGQTVFGAVSRASLGNGGRISREVAGNGIPNGIYYGNVGDQFSRLDATSATCAKWIKQTGSSTNTGWVPLIQGTQSVAFSGSLAVNLQSGNRVQVGALTANITHSSPTNVPPQGFMVSYEFIQDATGGRTITWSSLHKGAWPTSSGTGGQKQTVRGVSDGANIVFHGASGWY